MTTIPAAWTTRTIEPIDYDAPSEDDPPTMYIPEEMGWEKYKRPYKARPKREEESWLEYTDALERDFEDYGILRQLCDPARRLLKAIVSGAPIDVLDDLFNKGALLYEREPLTGNSAIHEALYHDNIDAMRWLLERGLPWWMEDIRHKCAIEYHRGSRCWKFLMRWAIEYDYARLSRAFVDDTNKYQSHPIDIIPRKNNNDFLQSPCEYITQDDGVSKDFVMRTKTGKDRVMMLWERPIMERTAKALMDGQEVGNSVLNIGFGIGLIDTQFQNYSPANHTIIEAHPDAIAYFNKIKFASPASHPLKKCNTGQDGPVSKIRLLEGTWRSVFSDPAKRADLGTFDAIYFDTFQESYREFLEFFKYVPGLMKRPGSRMSFFHGHGRGGEMLYQVYKETLTMHLNDIGLHTTWIDAPKIEQTRWTTESYTTGAEMPISDSPWLIPVCVPAPTIPLTPTTRSNFFSQEGIEARGQHPEGSAHSITGSAESSVSEEAVRVVSR